MAITSVPAPVATQLAALNTNVNKLIEDRSRIISIFDDALGGSVYNLLTPANQTAFKNAIVNDMQTAVNNLQAVVNALAAM